jgi:hypothetical protein
MAWLLSFAYFSAAHAQIATKSMDAEPQMQSIFILNEKMKITDDCILAVLINGTQTKFWFLDMPTAKARKKKHAGLNYVTNHVDSFIDHHGVVVDIADLIEDYAVFGYIEKKTNKKGFENFIVHYDNLLGQTVKKRLPLNEIYKRYLPDNNIFNQRDPQRHCIEKNLPKVDQ